MSPARVSVRSMGIGEYQSELTGISRVSAAKFATKWKDTVEEQQNSQAFWNDFFRDLLGITDIQAAGIEFEKKVTSSKKGTTTRIDVFWKDTLLIEQKSAGRDLDAAEHQAREYVVSLPPALRPPVIIVSDFARFRIVDILLNKSHEFLLENLADNLDRIEAVISHKAAKATQVQVDADQKAAQLMADLYIQLEKYGYEGHEASVFMVRILFCLFADDTRMWKADLFHNLVKDTNPLGTDLGPRLSNLFSLLDTPKEQRRGPQDPLVEDFPYVNGGIFSEHLGPVNFNGPMRNALMNACMYDWSSINPTIFGALFQDIKSKDERRANGEHYTTEENIDKVIAPLFLDELHEKLEDCWDSEGKLLELQRELGSLKILDPACGCGNFLITTYKRLRQLELDIIMRVKQLNGTLGQTSLLDVREDIHVKLEQLHGIEYVEWSSQISRVAVYLADHQENLKLETVLGVAANRFPLSEGATIVQGNALNINWSEVCSIDSKTVILGNPPFKGSKYLDAEQRADQARIWGGLTGSGTMDYVTNWIILGADWVARSNARVAFVSTNSISQGDQPAMIWGLLAKHNVKISFAHRSFMWENDNAGRAGVHCVIIGLRQKSEKIRLRLWEYPDSKGSPIEKKATNINAYLVDGPDILVKSQRSPIATHMPKMISGNKPRDGGYLSSIDLEEAEMIRASDPIAAKYLLPLVGAEELINGKGGRYCLWLVDASPNDIRSSKILSLKVSQVFEERKGAPSSKGAAADRPMLFEAITQPNSRFIAVPGVSSEKRKYIPMGLLEPTEIINNRIFAVLSSDMEIFAMLQSRWFTLWVEAVASRLELRFVIAAGTVYNTFPFPDPSNDIIQELRDLGGTLLLEQAKYGNATLADLYDPFAMPSDVLSVHKRIDITMLKAFGLPKNSDEADVLNYLFNKYVEMLSNSAGGKTN